MTSQNEIEERELRELRSVVGGLPADCNGRPLMLDEECYVPKVKGGYERGKILKISINYVGDIICAIQLWSGGMRFQPSNKIFMVHREEATDERDRLRAVVHKLPLSRDGFPLWAGQKSWRSVDALIQIISIQKKGDEFLCQVRYGEDEYAYMILDTSDKIRINGPDRQYERFQ